MFFKSKVKTYIRQKIIAIYLDNYIKSNDGTVSDEWGNNWLEKSYNDVLFSFKSNEKNGIILSKFDLIAIKWTINIEEDFIYAPLYALHEIYFNREPNTQELNKLRVEFKAEKNLRDIRM